MRLLLPTFLLVFFSHLVLGQEKTVLFSDAIKTNIKKYNKDSNNSFENGDIAQGQALFDSLVQNHLVGSRFDDYTFKSVNGKKVKLSKIGKPVFIITYSSWCVINRGEIAALYKLARTYEDQIQFIVVFWDTKSNMKRIGKQFNAGLKVCYANESYRNDATAVATLKHTLGFPTSYFLNSELEVVDIKRGGISIPVRTPSRKAMEMNYAVFNERLVNFLGKSDQNQIAATTDD